jgi:cell division protein FtsN
MAPARKAEVRLMTASRLVLAATLVLALALSACSRRQTEWEAARAADTVESYERFLKTFPQGEFSSQAEARARELREARDWKKAVTTNTLASYQQFVAQYPEGRMSDEARIRIETYAMATAPTLELPQAAAEIGSTAAPPKPLASSAPAATSAPPAPAVNTATAAQSGYRVQLGAFAGGEKQAMGEWRRLQRDYPQLLEGLKPSVKLATTTTGHLYRLQAGMTDEARARDICAKLKDEAQACVVVLP